VADRNKVSAKQIANRRLDDTQLAEHVPAALLEKLREDMKWCASLACRR